MSVALSRCSVRLLTLAFTLFNSLTFGQCPEPTNDNFGAKLVEIEEELQSLVIDDAWKWRARAKLVFDDGFAESSDDPYIGEVPGDSVQTIPLSDSGDKSVGGGFNIASAFSGTDGFTVEDGGGLTIFGLASIEDDAGYRYARAYASGQFVWELNDPDQGSIATCPRLSASARDLPGSPARSIVRDPVQLKLRAKSGRDELDVTLFEVQHALGDQGDIRWNEGVVNFTSMGGATGFFDVRVDAEDERHQVLDKSARGHLSFSIRNGVADPTTWANTGVFRNVSFPCPNGDCPDDFKLDLRNSVKMDEGNLRLDFDLARAPDLESYRVREASACGEVLVMDWSDRGAIQSFDLNRPNSKELISYDASILAGGTGGTVTSASLPHLRSTGIGPCADSFDAILQLAGPMNAGHTSTMTFDSIGRETASEIRFSHRFRLTPPTDVAEAGFGVALLLSDAATFAEEASDVEFGLHVGVDLLDGGERVDRLTVSPFGEEIAFDLPPTLDIADGEWHELLVRIHRGGDGFSGVLNIFLDDENISEGKSPFVDGFLFDEDFVLGVGARTGGKGIVEIDDVSLQLQPIKGDLNGDGQVDAADVDLISANLRRGLSIPDLDGDGKMSLGDRNFLIFELVGTAEDKGTLLGDANLDGRVTFPDFLAVSKNFSSRSGVWVGGDFDGDGAVGFPDFLIVAENFGRTTSTGLVSPLPEPRAAVMVRIAAIALALCRRRIRERNEG